MRANPSSRNEAEKLEKAEHKHRGAKREKMGRENGNRSGGRGGRSGSRNGRGGGRSNCRSNGTQSNETKASAGVPELSDSVFFINRPNQAHNFIKVKEKIMNYLNKELKDEGAMGKALEEGKQFDETKPTLWKLGKDGQPEKDNNGNFIEDKIDKSSIRGYEFMQDCADWRKRREKCKQNKVVASAIILGQCSKNVVTKLEANVDWDSIRHEPIKLLAAIQAIMQNSEDEKHHTQTVSTLIQKSVNTDF